MKRIGYGWLFVCCIALTGYPATDEELQQRYQAAIEDARITQADEIYPFLTPLIEENTALQWRGEPGRKQVLMITWTQCEYYQGLKGKTVNVNTLPSSFSSPSGQKSVMASYMVPADIWVTAVPELDNFIKNNPMPYNAMCLRLEQLLGLPPHDGKTCFVSYWVYPEDLVRPCPDAEVTDSVAELDFPPETPQEYRDWFNNMKENMYDNWRYPWTRLGYTYDWGNPDSEVGLSEFILRKRPDNPIYVQINEIIPNQEFFASLSSASYWELY
jgi:hypothetical protein